MENAKRRVEIKGCSSPSEINLPVSMHLLNPPFARWDSDWMGCEIDRVGKLRAEKGERDGIKILLKSPPARAGVCASVLVPF